METLIEKTHTAQCKARLQFKTADIDSLEILSDFFNRFPTRSSDFSIGGILLWTKYFDYKYCIYNDTLFLRGTDTRGWFFHQPLGSGNEIESYLLIREYCDLYGRSARIIMPQECEPENIEDCEITHSSSLPDWREYVYEIDQFIGFKGKKMAKKRNHLNYFMNHFSNYEMEILDGTQTKELIEFNDKFNLYHKEGETFDYESHAISKALSDYTKYPFFGLLLRYNGEIIGYTFGEAIGDTFSIHAEKGDIDYQGVYQALSSLLSRKIAEVYPQVKYLNREDDMGNDYLRQSKLSYHPSKFIAKWEISA